MNSQQSSQHGSFSFLSRYAWLIVLGTALALSWWSLDALACSYGMPRLLAGMVSACFDGAGLAAADLALRRAAKAHPALGVKLLMFAAVGLSAWLNYEHGLLLGYPVAARVLFAAPSCLAGWLFELQLHGMRLAVAEARSGTAERPEFGRLIWLFHPWAALRLLSRIADSQLRSIPVTVMDWQSPVPPSLDAAVPDAEEVELPTPVAAGYLGHEAAQLRERQGPRPVSPKRMGRKQVPDEVYAEQLSAYLATSGAPLPSGREAARILHIGQERARRIVGAIASDAGGTQQTA